MALGYGNFDTVIQYDVYSMAETYMRDANSWICQVLRLLTFILILAFMMQKVF